MTTSVRNCNAISAKPSGTPSNPTQLPFCYLTGNLPPLRRGIASTYAIYG